MAQDETFDLEKSIGSFVHARISTMQGDYLSPNKKSRGARHLAMLRHALMMPIGSDADAWSLEFDGLPEQLVGRGPSASQGEIAVHAALTLYAVHQQGKSDPMHVRGYEHGLGNAVRQMVSRDHNRYANLEFGEMPRRFRALITAESMDETLHYARQLVQQLRREGIPLDYSLLAKQFFNLQNPYRVDQVRISWGRGYTSTSGTNAAAAGTEASELK